MKIKTTVVNVHKIHGKRTPCDVYIGRAVSNTEFTTHSKWANLFRVNQFKFPTDCLYYYEQEIRRKILVDPVTYDLRELAGKRLGCWCINTDKILPLVCHGQVLLKLIREAGLE